jgi:hypothetical protein
LSDTEKDYREIYTQLQFWTGGVPGVARPNFIQLNVFAWDRLANVAIPPTNVTMWSGAYEKRCDSNGNVYISGADNNWYTCTPQAHQAGYSNYTFTVVPAVAYLAITRGTNNVAGQTNTVIVGEQITLTAKFVDAAGNDYNIAPITNFQWSIPGNYISNFVGTATNSIMYALTNAADFTNSSVKFAWVDGSGGALFEVQCTAIVKGVTVTAKTKFNVIRPSVDWIGTITGNVGINPNLVVNGEPRGPALQFGTNFPQSSGMTFLLTNLNLNGWSGISWDFLSVQIGTSTRTFSETNGTNFVAVGAGLDEEYPYEVFPLGVHEVVKDSPAVPLASYGAVSVIDSFSMFLLFEPSSGVPVPVRRIDWNWRGTAAISNGIWNLVPRVGQHRDKREQC